ncbi:iron-sulfur cluster assembly accessory protein [Arenibaculum sp.]|uniref:HesB/IscA family protein n=1 Tax=Arenibaculum sp. TaxID=2865862 RepID=UPI002E0E0CD2|nr:iron-sulfur cluster assembly accessory protein [Arenibaculum sp.]
MNQTKTVMSITDAAADRVKSLMTKAEDGAIGLRIGLRARGCSGMSYTVEYAKDVKKFEEVVEDKGVRILIDPAATMFLIGTEIDYVEDKIQSGFVFRNPNEKARCGCGESFSV